MERKNINGIRQTLPPVIIGMAHPVIEQMTEEDGGKTTEKEGFRLLDELWDLGLNMYDCAAIYGEAALGAYLAERKRRADAVIVTKCAHPNRYRNRVTPFDMESDLHDSLAKLRTDYIDIYLLHRDDPTVPVGEILETMNRFQKEGKIGIFGASNWSMERVEEANRTAAENGWNGFSVVSPNYGLAHQMTDVWGWGSTTLTGPEHEKDREWCIQHGIPVLAYSSMARGFFSGKFRSNEPEKAESILDEFAQKGYYYPENMERLRRAEILAEKYQCSTATIAIGYMFCQEMQVFPIISGSRTKYFGQALEAAELPLTASEAAWLDLRGPEDGDMTAEQMTP